MMNIYTPPYSQPLSRDHSCSIHLHLSASPSSAGRDPSFHSSRIPAALSLSHREVVIIAREPADFSFLREEKHLYIYRARRAKTQESSPRVIQQLCVCVLAGYIKHVRACMGAVYIRCGIWIGCIIVRVAAGCERSPRRVMHEVAVSRSVV